MIVTVKKNMVTYNSLCNGMFFLGGDWGPYFAQCPVQNVFYMKKGELYFYKTIPFPKWAEALINFPL